MRGEILRKDPIPELEECYALVRHEDVRRRVMNGQLENSVSTTNGTSIPIIGEGSLSLTNTLNLDSILVVPYLNYNIFSVSQIITALFCVVIFLPKFCVFKDIRTRKTIGCGVRRGKLYYLDLVYRSSDELHQALMIRGSKKKKKGNLRYGYDIDIWGMLLLVT